MITTRFLVSAEYSKYAEWLKKLDSETRTTYFGIYQPDEQIDNLVQNIVANSSKHNFIVAEFVGQWIGVIHMAETVKGEIEFGVIVDPEHRNKGIADRMLSEAVIWARNRGYESLYMHCLSWNTPIKKLCTKHGMKLETESGETETKLKLPPADLQSLSAEVIERNRNIYRMVLQTAIPVLAKVYA